MATKLKTQISQERKPIRRGVFLDLQRGYFVALDGTHGPWPLREEAEQAYQRLCAAETAKVAARNARVAWAINANQQAAAERKNAARAAAKVTAGAKEAKRIARAEGKHAIIRESYACARRGDFRGWARLHLDSRSKHNKVYELPSDADCQLMWLIYRHRPEGFEVDHIIPLGKGKHHQDNLQYLRASANSRKGASLKYRYADGDRIEWKTVLLAAGVPMWRVTSKY